MTYIDYLNTFHQWCESNTLPVNSRLLYMDLLHVFNRAGWPENVRVDTIRLMVMASTSNKKTAYKAIECLQNAGLIHFEKGFNGNAYKITLFEIDEDLLKACPEIEVSKEPKIKVQNRNTKEYRDWRIAVFERDNFTCQIC